ncbi:MAG: BACON domain-containing protein, partial [Bacteroidales bacterium]|nr:BACON domain-containing protein [Bacteroidales bacterium]
MKNVFALLLLTGAVLVACTKAPEVATQLEIDATELVITDDPGVKQLSIKANGPWHMEISEEWVVASKLSGSGDAVVKFGVLPNKDYSSREAQITIKAGSITRTVKLTQAQMDGIILGVDALETSYEAGEYVIPVETNIAITAESDAAWLEVADTKGLVEKGIAIGYPLNPGRESREGHITISGDGLKQVFTVTQGAFEPEFDLDDEQGVGPWGTLTAPKEGLTYTFPAVTNMDFTADAPDADWIHVTKEGDVVTVVVDENPAAARVEYIYMGCSKEDVDYSDYGAMIKVRQKGQAQAEEIWKMDFYWGIFPQGSRVSTAVAGDYFILYSPNAITPGFHLMNKADGTEASVVAAPENVTGITNDEAGNVIVTTGGNYPISEETWALIPEMQIPLKVYVLTQEEFLSGTIGEPIITYNDDF